MSHFPIVQPLSVGQFGGGSYTLVPGVGVNTLATLNSYTTPNLDFTVLTSYRLFITGAKFLPLFIQVVSQESSAGSGIVAPVIHIGNNPTSYNNLVTNYTLSRVNTTTFGAGQWEMVPINYPFTSPWYGGSEHIIRIITPSDAAKDIRSVNVVGFQLS